MHETVHSEHASQDLKGLRIAVLNWRDHNHPRAGGAEAYALSVIDEFVARGAEVHYVTSRHEGSSRTETRSGYTVHRNGSSATVYLHTLLWLFKNRNQLDLVLDCSNGIAFFSPLAVSTKRTRVLHLIHHVHTEQWGQHLPAPAAAVGRFIEGPVSKLIYRNAHWVAVSPSTQIALKDRLEVRNSVSIAANGLPKDLLAVATTQDATPSLGHVVYVGRLVAHKRVDLLLEVAAHLKTTGHSIHVDIVGDGPDLAELKVLADRLDAPVTFHGRVDEETRDRLVRTAAVLAIPSSHEGWGLVVLEAAAVGVPAVGFDVDGIRDSIRHNETGWVLPEPDDRDMAVTAFGNALLTAIDTAADPARRIEMARKAQDWARQFTWQATAQSLLDAARVSGNTTKEKA